MGKSKRRVRFIAGTVSCISLVGNTGGFEERNAFG